MKPYGGSMRLIVACLFLISTAWGNTMKDLSNQDKVKVFFEKLTMENMGLVDEFYDSNIHFVDPVGELKGSVKMKKYYENMYQNVKYLRFDFSEFHVSGDTVIGIWKMTLKTDKLNGGEDIVVDGNSVIKFGQDGKAVYHRDYFDMGAFVYENIPVVGYVIRNIKSRFKVE
jgi:ketosteroid isomerase-like protein